MNNYVLVALLSAGAMFVLQGERWDADVTKRELAHAQAVAEAVDAVNAQRLVAEARVVTGQQIIDKVRLENDGREVELQRLNDCLRTGKCGLRVAAKCPGAEVRTVADPGPASGNTGGTLGPDADLIARALVWEREYPKQLKALRLCKAFGEQLQPHR